MRRIYKAIISSGVGGSLDDPRRRRILLTNQISVTFALFALSFGLGDFLSANYRLASFVGSVGLVMGLPPIINFFGRATLARWVLIGSAALLASVLSAYYDGEWALRCLCIGASSLPLLLFGPREKSSALITAALLVFCYQSPQIIDGAWLRSIIDLGPLPPWNHEALLGASLGLVLLCTVHLFHVNGSVETQLQSTIAELIDSVRRVEEAALAQAQAEATMRNQQALMMQQARMSALGEMAAGMAHEINNPLTVIIAKSSFMGHYLTRHGKIDPFLEQSIADIDKTALRIAAIIDSLRLFACEGRQDPPRAFSLQSTITDTMTFLRKRSADQGVTLIATPLVDDVKLFGQAAQIAQVVFCLLANAVDAVAGQAERWVRVDVRTSASWTDIAVSDSGPGIAGEIAARIMEPFFTTKEVGKGAGLGLSISRGIVEQHGGELIFERSAPHTTFIVRLPTRSINAPASPAEAA